MALTTMQKAGWGLADMGVVTFVIIKQLLVFAFLANVLGVPVALAGGLTTAVLLFDIVTDPVIGILSDKTRSRFGRRAPWMAVGAVVMAGAVIGMFSAPQGAGAAASLLWVGAFFVLATIGFTAVAIPYSAMSGEITHDPKERSAMTGWRMAAASVGILVGGAAVPGLAAAFGYSAAAMIAAPLMILPVWASLWLTRDARALEEPRTHAWRDGMRVVLRNRAFMALVLCYGVMTFAVALITAALPFAALYLIADSGTSALSGAAVTLTTLSLLFAAFVIGAMASQIVWVWLSGLIGKLSALILGLLLYVGLLLWLYTALPSTNVTWIALLFVVGGMTNGAYQQIPWAMYPDLMDVTRQQTGETVEGTFSAIWLLGQKIANALAPLALGLILAIFGWVETMGGGVIPQPATALATLRVTTTLVPAGVLLTSVALLLLLYRPKARAAGIG